MIGLLDVIQGPDLGKQFALPKGQKVSVGRGDHALVNLTDPLVSRLQCQVLVEGTPVLLTDGGNSGGTWVNSERVERHFLESGDVIRVGATQIAFRWTDSDEKQTETLGALPAQPSRSAEGRDGG